VGIGLVLKLIWKVSAVQLSDGDGKTGRDVADAEDAKGAATTTADSIARISNTAIVSSIAFPAIFQISITFEMPFGFPPVLVQFAEWVTSIVSLDLGQVGSPECAMEDEPEAVLLYKFLATVRIYCHSQKTDRSANQLNHWRLAAFGLPGALRAAYRAGVHQGLPLDRAPHAPQHQR